MLQKKKKEKKKAFLIPGKIMQRCYSLAPHIAEILQLVAFNVDVETEEGK